MSLRRLEKETGLSNAFLSQIENHPKNLSFEAAIQIAEALHLDLNAMAETFMNCRGRRG